MRNGLDRTHATTCGWGSWQRIFDGEALTSPGGHAGTRFTRPDCGLETELELPYTRRTPMRATEATIAHPPQSYDPQRRDPIRML